MYKKDAGGKVVESEEYVYNESSQLTEATIYDGKKTASMSYTYDGDGDRVFQLNYNLHLQCGKESASDKTAFYAGRCYFEVKMLEADLGVAAITVKGIYEGVQSGITRLGTLLDDSIGIGGGGAAVIAANGSAAYAGLGNLAAIGALLSAAPGSLSGMEQRLGRLQENFEKMLESGKGGSGAGKGDSDTYKAPEGGGGVTDRIKVGDTEVSFGHGGRHLEGTNLSVQEVNQAISKDVINHNVGTGKFYKGRISIKNIVIEYTSFGVKDGLINIGTYYPVQ